MNEQQADDIFHRLTKCVLTMERVKSSSLNDRSEFCPFTSETGNWPQIDQIFPSLRKEKKENLVNLYTRIPFSIFYSSRPLFPDINQYFKHRATTKIFMSQFYDNIATSHRREKWKIFRHLFLSYIISTMRITCQRDAERNGKNYITKMLLYTRRYLWTRLYRDQVKTCKGCNGRKRSKQRELNLTREYPFLFNTTHGSWPGLYRLCIHVRVSRALFDPIPRISRNKYFYNFYAVVEGSRAW